MQYFLYSADWGKGREARAGYDVIQDQKNACGNVSPSVTRNHSIFGDVSFRMQEVISVWSQIVTDTALGRKFALMEQVPCICAG